MIQNFATQYDFLPAFRLCLSFCASFYFFMRYATICADSDKNCVISCKIFHDLKTLFQQFLRLALSALGIYQDLLESIASVKF